MIAQYSILGSSNLVHKSYHPDEIRTKFISRWSISNYVNYEYKTYCNLTAIAIQPTRGILFWALRQPTVIEILSRKSFELNIYCNYFIAKKIFSFTNLIFPTEMNGHCEVKIVIRLRYVTIVIRLSLHSASNNTYA